MPCGKSGDMFFSLVSRSGDRRGEAALGLVNYIHLTSAGRLVTVAKLQGHEWSSYPKFFKSRPAQPLRRNRFLYALELPDSVAGMRQYERHLEFAEESELRVMRWRGDTAEGRR
jgi:hypothetical protein